MPRYRSGADDRDERIRRLEEDLWFARTTIIDLAPEHVRGLVKAQWLVSSRADLTDWRRWVTAEVIDAADKRPGEQMGEYSGTDRAYCPLCGEGSSGPYSSGYSIPIGLERHLRGTHRQRQCGVLMAADRLALDRVNERESGARQVASDAVDPPWKEKPAVSTPGKSLPLGPSAAILSFPSKGAVDAG